MLLASARSLGFREAFAYTIIINRADCGAQNFES